MLWIALHLPSLSLETFSAAVAAQDAGRPVALLGAHRIVAADAAARALGVVPGLKRATALSLAPHLVLGEADRVRDADALGTVAHAALAFTPSVSIAPASSAADADLPHTVLLEVRSSLRYFGGLAALRRRLHDTLAPLGHRLHTVGAPTPLGATLLARVHAALHCADLPALRCALEAAPVWLLGPGRTHWEALQGMGLRTIADLRRLPRPGLARRFGEAVLDEVDRAFGAVPDPREALTPPPVFESRLELFARADTTEQVMHGAGLLLSRLVAWLGAQHASARRFTLAMVHEPRRWRDRGLAAEAAGTQGRPADERAAGWAAAARAIPAGPGGAAVEAAPAAPTVFATTLDVALAEPSRDAAHLLVLLRERLARTVLAAPTLELRLHCDDIARRPPPHTELFPTPRGEREGLTRLIERLQARLGAAQVQRLREVHDHRPERATELVRADAVVRPSAARAGAAQAASPVRPIWLLPAAEPLQEQGAGPLLGGRPLRLLSGPERIESGWWDGELAERDYYIAQDDDGALVWIYRSRLLFSAPGAGWFLHGRFG